MEIYVRVEIGVQRVQTLEIKLEMRTDYFWFCKWCKIRKIYKTGIILLISNTSLDEIIWVLTVINIE